MKAVCKQDCTVPGKGIVFKGQTINVKSADEKKFPFLKHFDVVKTKKAAAKKDAPKEDAPKDDSPKKVDI